MRKLTDGDIPQNINFAVKGAEALAFLERQGVNPALAASTGPEKGAAEVGRHCQPVHGGPALLPLIPSMPAAPAAAMRRPGLPGLIALGLLAAALFSCTFVLNRSVSLAGGPWVWNAALRYIDMAVLLLGWIGLRHGGGRLLAVLRLFWRRMGFWLVAGGIGFGLFYGCMCFAADHAPGWIVAATWQCTILATPIVLWAFGSRVPRRGVLFAVVIVAGIGVLNMHAFAGGAGARVAAIVPVLVAAFAYPFGNQLLNRARHGVRDPDNVLRDPAACVLLMTLGALPVLLAAVLVVGPPPPTLARSSAPGWWRWSPGAARRRCSSMPATRPRTPIASLPWMRRRARRSASPCWARCCCSGPLCRI